MAPTSFFFYWFLQSCTKFTSDWGYSLFAFFLSPFNKLVLRRTEAAGDGKKKGKEEEEGGGRKKKEK